MNPFSILGAVLRNAWWVIPAIIVIGFLKSSWFKGFLGELVVRIATRFTLDRNEYRAFHNVTLPTPDGTTQIDHIFVSPFGIFVVETKHMKGWIFGAADQATWTQKIYRKSFKFQNPLRQNYKHVKTLEAALGVPSETIHSIVVFVGGSTFKTPMPENVTYPWNCIRIIKSRREVVFSPAEVETIVARIASGRLAPSLATHRLHVRNLEARKHSESERRCPRCGSPMVLRTVKRGARAGTQFWGCSAYPRCHAVQEI